MLQLRAPPVQTFGWCKPLDMESWHDSKKMPAAKTNEGAGATSTADSASQVQVYAEFVGSFASRYQRNNKRSGIKNLRCFPRCSYPHRSQGFCGQPVVVRFMLRSKDLKAIFPNPDAVTFCAVAEFRLLSNGIDPKDGSQLTKKFYYSKLRNKEKPMNPWIDGLQTAYNVNSQGNINLEFEFNSVKKGWHYGWVSNKHTCEAKHCLQVSLFATERNSEQMTCICATPSPNFRIFCRRRSRPLGGSDTETTPIAYPSVPHGAVPPMQLQAPQHYLNTFTPYAHYSSSNFEQVRPTGLQTPPLAAGTYGMARGAYPVIDHRMTPGVAHRPYYVDPSAYQALPTAHTQEPSIALQMKLLSLLLKVEVGEDGKLRPIARGSEALTREVSMLRLDSPQNPQQQTANFEVDESMLQLKHLNLGIQVDSSKLALGKQLARHLTSSSQFLNTVSLLQSVTGGANSQTEMFIRGVQEELPGFFQHSYVTPQQFYLQFCSTSSLLGARAQSSGASPSEQVMPPMHGVRPAGLHPYSHSSSPALAPRYVAMPQYPGYYVPYPRGAPLQSSVSRIMQPEVPKEPEPAPKRSTKRKSSSSSKPKQKPKQKRKRKEE